MCSEFVDDVFGDVGADLAKYKPDIGVCADDGGELSTNDGQVGIEVLGGKNNGSPAECARAKRSPTLRVAKAGIRRG